MDAHKDGEGLKRELGLSRRQLLKRGAVVGGTLMWAAPTIQSLASPAFAQMGASPGRHGCCYCYNGDISDPSPNNPATGTPDECNNDGLNEARENRDACENSCRDLGYENSQYQSGANFCQCNTSGAPGDNGCECA